MYRMQKLSKEVEEDRAEGISSPLVNKIGELKVSGYHKKVFQNPSRKRP